MLHSLICGNEANYVLLSRYFQPQLTLKDRQVYEAQLAQICKQMPDLWGDRQTKVDLASVQSQLIVCESQFVVVRQIGELRLMLSGNEEYDELILDEIMTVLQAVLMTQLDKKLTEASLLLNYAKVVVALDEMVQEGHLENLDEVSIDQMIKLKPYPSK
ncbi:coatomer subunit zeta-1-like [Plasmopara halstedii]|uniref:Coatomer subunit zeta n=1 Tax=Plasmopara halstedii TaxID=4781 RepID=A0A0N7L6Y7_PLAHL|nr:coatomer subunit zeta-1-like [Plasmopara halstedii]CEG45587.1 coatomer subunit zeta-1-like [Plasmopara halstedii]|eukprot:XP_024581956.1 coatomer subunit zeta-1-like [Plasmopara halstedii]